MDVIQNISFGEKGYYESFSDTNLEGPIFKYENESILYPKGKYEPFDKELHFDRYYVNDIVPKQIISNFKFSFGKVGESAWAPLDYIKINNEKIYYIEPKNTSNSGQITAGSKGGSFKVKVEIKDGEQVPMEDGTVRTYTKNGGFYFEGNKKEEASFQLAGIKADIKVSKDESRAEKAENKRLLQEEVAARKALKAEKGNKKAEAHTEKEVVVKAKKGSVTNVLVICYGAGTSAMLAESAKRGLRAHEVKNIEFDSAAYGAHKDKIQTADLVILSPQVKMYIDDIKQTANSNTKFVVTSAKQYSDATKDKENAYKLIKENLPELFK
ncbi:hypothetical protein FQA39_LY12883 [Lamprigera yunnana]|nr:hypothetical protein FQA39_LY12883 [Lamprigera yunnana]